MATENPWADKEKLLSMVYSLAEKAESESVRLRSLEVLLEVKTPDEKKWQEAFGQIADAIAGRPPSDEGPIDC